ncbi:MAG: NADH-quinone oxidoreductase subunit L, partial [Candidatus Thermoplasmatota archaeon]|nr:NADH-quinone oxidoreductase subunit L [Candidatus Thermoplasmatota archaeon]
MADLSWIVDISWLIVASPLVAFFIIIITGKRQWEGGAAWSIGSIGLSFILSLILLIHALLNGALGGDFGAREVIWYRWLGSEELGQVIQFGILVDALSVLMLTIVSFLSLLIVVYSLGYMRHEKDKARYYSQISLFVTGMLGTVSANNFLLLLIFWEIMGLCSYLLIGFWYHKPKAASAAKKAFMVTRVGDVLFLVGVIAVFVLFGTFNIVEVSRAAPGLPVHLVAIVPILFFAGAMGKSAQFPLHAWLPDAMEGPTTVSALIHAATMVKAGVYLTARAIPLISNSIDASLFVAIIGGFTAFFAATMALASYDIKRVLAFSTISQLGYMFLALGTAAYAIQVGMAGSGEAYSAAFFHLTNHAFFKALLFLGAGSVIHALGTNDMRKMGGLQRRMPITSMVMLIGALSISGIPPFSGFWSKDEILAAVYGTSGVSQIFLYLWIVGVLTAFMTAFYMFRVIYLTFHGEYRGGNPEAETHPHESPRVMVWPMVFLAVLAVGAGWWNVTGAFGDFMGHGETKGFIDGFFGIFGSWLPWVSLLFAGAGIYLAYLMYAAKRVSPERMAARFRPLYTAFLRKFWLDELYEDVIVRKLLIGGLFRGLQKVDTGGIDAAVDG